MRLVLTGRHVEITPALRTLVDQKCARLLRLIGRALVSAQATLTQEKYRARVEITVHARGDHMLHGVGESPDWEASASEAVEKLVQQAQTLKGKWTKRKRLVGDGKPRGRAALPAEASPARRIVRARRYRVKPMTLDEAAIEADNNGGVVVFRNAATDAISVLYRRNDGALGLIEPDA